MPKEPQEPIQPEWSYLIPDEEAGTEITSLKISPSAEERAALARRLNLLSLDRLEAELNIERQSGGMIVHVSGRFQAGLRQSCVVTLDPVESRVEDEFEAWYADPENAVIFAKARRDMQAQEDGETQILEEWEDPEPISNGHIDVGELVAQYLSLAINPYPHAEGVKPPQDEDKVVHREEPPEIRKNPFEKLKEWKEKYGAKRDEE